MYQMDKRWLYTML